MQIAAGIHAKRLEWKFNILGQQYTVYYTKKRIKKAFFTMKELILLGNFSLNEHSS